MKIVAAALLVALLGCATAGQDIPDPRNRYGMPEPGSPYPYNSRGW